MSVYEDLILWIKAEIVRIRDIANHYKDIPNLQTSQLVQVHALERVIEKNEELKKKEEDG